jgi:hypothetical protein
MPSKSNKSPAKRANVEKKLVKVMRQVTLNTPKRKTNKPKKNNALNRMRQINYTAPLTVGSVSSAASSNKRVSFRSDARLLTEIIPSAQAINGRVLVNRLFTPQTIPGENFIDYCEVWAKYTISKLTFRLIPDAPSSVTGRLMLAWVPDPEFVLSETDPVSILNQLRGSGVSTAGNYWTPQEIDVSRYLKHDRSASWGGWYTNPSANTLATEPYWCSPGRLMLVCDGDASGFTGPINIAIDVCMDIQFWEPIVRSRNTPGVVRTNIDVSVLETQEPFLIDAGGRFSVRALDEIGQELHNQAAAIYAEIQLALNLGTLPIPTVTTLFAIGRMENFTFPRRTIAHPVAGIDYNNIRNSSEASQPGIFVYDSIASMVADTPNVGVPGEAFGFGGLQLLTITVEPSQSKGFRDRVHSAQV